ncbi:virion protein [Vibrio phage VpKK5]|uniref:structural protein n=1 Tax=Vibrio phage VpKK5 TaxID=1538804 RepID=UPI0004F720D2|nr:structural protein [Vibrio phage VpKK5]AIM40630.1 virion protein [Vibrio phage VpKK5]
MAWENGTVSGHKEILVALHAFASANGWTVRRWDTPVDGEYELILQSTGTVGDDSIVLAFRTNSLPESDTFNIRCKASSVFVDVPYDTLVNASPDSAVYSWDGDIPYYFIVNLDRIMIATFVSGTTQYYYGGNLRTYTSRGHWPAPVCSFCVGTNVNARWSSQGNDYSGWQYIRGTNPCHLQNYNSAWTKPNAVFPNMYTGIYDTARPYENGDVPLSPMMYSTSADGVVGEVVGAYHVAGFSLANGQILDHDDGRQFLVVQNVYRADQYDYLVMELV